MRILVTGANGQVGHELLRVLADAWPPVGAGLAGDRRSDAGRGLGRAQARSYTESRRSCNADRAPARSYTELGRSCNAGRAKIRSKRFAQARSYKKHGSGNAREIIPATRSGHLEDGTPCERIDLSDADDLRKALDRIAPDLVINAAAYTTVDRAEDEPAIAQRVNGNAPGSIGAWAARRGTRVVHYSTDYVFDGRATRPYREDDPTDPLGVYGRTKLAGEIALRESGAAHLIFRTAWVYAARGHNFLLTMLRLGAERDVLRVVDDQIGAPTPAHLIADVTAQAVARWCADGAPVADGVYHLVAAGQTSWCGFARAIFERAHRAGLLTRTPDVQAIRSADYPTRATRPAWSVLDTAKLRDTFDFELPTWQNALDSLIAELLIPLSPGGGQG